MAYEQSISERIIPNGSPIGRRQALCTFAGIATVVAGFGLFGVGTANAADATGTINKAHGDTVTAEEAIRRAEDEAVTARELALVESLIPASLDVGTWAIQKVHAPRMGAIAVVMQTPAGETFQLDVLRRDSAISGVAETKHFAVFVANSGDGSKATEEWQARGAKVLAHHIRRTELGGAPLPVLMSFSERANRHPSGNYGVLG